MRTFLRMWSCALAACCGACLLEGPVARSSPARGLPQFELDGGTYDPCCVGSASPNYGTGPGYTFPAGSPLLARLSLDGHEPGALDTFDLWFTGYGAPFYPGVGLSSGGLTLSPQDAPGQFLLLAPCPGEANLGMSIDGYYVPVLNLAATDPAHEKLGIGYWDSSWSLAEEGVAIPAAREGMLRVEWVGACGGSRTQRAAGEATLTVVVLDGVVNVAVSGFTADLIIGSSPASVQVTATAGAARLTQKVVFR